MSADQTAKALLQLCRRRAVLLRRTLDALEGQEPGAHWAVRTMDTLDRELESVERDIKWQEKQNNGRDSD